MGDGVHPFLQQLDRALECEVKYRLGGSEGGGMITRGMRDGSAHVLRCLKVWYDLPSDIFFNAISNVDRFLAKMKAQPKHLSCIAVSAFHLASHQYRKEKICPPEPEDLVTISQSRCSSSDLLRMEGILAGKLEEEEDPVTVLSFLRLMLGVSRAASLQLGLGGLPDTLPDHLLHQLEILACDSLTLKFRPCEVALALLTTDFQRRAGKKPGLTNALMGFITELQKYCNISGGNFVDCLDTVVELLNKYNGEATVTHRQRLVWKLSNRTLRHLRPTHKLRPTLPTIQEKENIRIRSSSESSGEESFETDSDREEWNMEWREDDICFGGLHQ